MPLFFWDSVRDNENFIFYCKQQMKKFMKIGALSLTLVASLLLLSNITKAETGVLSLEVQKGTGSCVYGTSINLGIQTASYDALTFSGVFPQAFRCEDNNGTAATWVLSTSVGVLTNSINPLYTIPATSVEMKSDLSDDILGSCALNSGTTTYTPINTVQPILGKNNDLGAICKIEAENVWLKVVTADNQPVGVYTGELTINVPSFVN
jgi:hypothetical protein